MGKTIYTMLSAKNAGIFKKFSSEKTHAFPLSAYFAKAYSSIKGSLCKILTVFSENASDKNENNKSTKIKQLQFNPLFFKKLFTPQNLVPLLIAVVILILVASQSIFIVHQTQKAIVVQLGNPRNITFGPGMHFKIPLIQNVIYFDARILDYDARPAEALTSDKKTIMLDNYARWRIISPIDFYRTVRTIPAAQARLDAVVYSHLRAQLGSHTLTEVVSSERSEIMEKVTEDTSRQMKEFGIEVIDVRIKRTDLPRENQRAIFDRMRAERERQAKQYRSEGTEESTKIRSEADKERAIILADANYQAQVLQGEGDGEAARIYGDAFSKEPSFYEFQRGLQAMQKSLSGNSKIFLSGDHPLLQSLKLPDSKN